MKLLFKKLISGGRSTEDVYSIKFGIARGVLMRIDLKSKFQRLIGIDEWEIQPHFKILARKAILFIDIGASDGYYSLLYKKFNSNGKIIAFEPDKRFTIEQTENMALNNYNEKDFDFRRNLVGNEVRENFTTLDQILSGSWKSVFIKMDAEGAELDILKGAERLLSSNTDISFIIETHSLELEQQCSALLMEHSFKATIVRNAFWRRFLPEQRFLKHNRWLIATKSKVDTLSPH